MTRNPRLKAVTAAGACIIAAGVLSTSLTGGFGAFTPSITNEGAASSFVNPGFEQWEIGDINGNSIPGELLATSAVGGSLVDAGAWRLIPDRHMPGQSTESRFLFKNTDPNAGGVFAVKVGAGTTSTQSADTTTITFSTAGFRKTVLIETGTITGMKDRWIVIGNLAAQGNPGDELEVIVTVTVEQAATAGDALEGVSFTYQLEVTGDNPAPVNIIAAPTAPTAVTVSNPTQTSLDVSWDAPLSDGGSAITDYVVEYSSDSGASWTEFFDGVSADTNLTVTDLTEETDYLVRVTAVNAVGASVASVEVSGTTEAKPIYYIGGPGEAGGRVFYISPAKDYYLEASPMIDPRFYNDKTDEVTEVGLAGLIGNEYLGVPLVWPGDTCASSLTGLSSSFGSGADNTARIASQCNANDSMSGGQYISLSRWASVYKGNSIGNWYIPPIEEVETLRNAGYFSDHLSRIIKLRGLSSSTIPATVVWSSSNGTGSQLQGLVIASGVRVSIATPSYEGTRLGTHPTYTRLSEIAVGVLVRKGNIP